MATDSFSCHYRITWSHQGRRARLLTSERIKEGIENVLRNYYYYPSSSLTTSVSASSTVVVSSSDTVSKVSISTDTAASTIVRSSPSPSPSTVENGSTHTVSVANTPSSTSVSSLSSLSCDISSILTLTEEEKDDRLRNLFHIFYPVSNDRGPVYLTFFRPDDGKVLYQILQDRLITKDYLPEFYKVPVYITNVSDVVPTVVPTVVVDSSEETKDTVSTNDTQCSSPLTKILSIMKQDYETNPSTVPAMYPRDLRTLPWLLPLPSSSSSSSSSSSIYMASSINQNTSPIPENTNIGELPGVPGLIVIYNFITEDEEQTLLQDIQKEPWSSQLTRRVQHYGYAFEYATRTVTSPSSSVASADDTSSSLSSVSPAASSSLSSSSSSTPTGKAISIPISKIPTIENIAANLSYVYGFIGNNNDKPINQYYNHLQLTKPFSNRNEFHQYLESKGITLPNTTASSSFSSLSPAPSSSSLSGSSAFIPTNQILTPLPLSIQQSSPYADINQVTINEYVPGRGIASHIDTHSGFEDGIVSLSLAADTVMEFKYTAKESNISSNSKDGSTSSDTTVNPNLRTAIHYVYLPRRSLFVLRGEARFAWTHYIPPRKTDCINHEIIRRSIRISVTFRHVRTSPCTCAWPSVCFDQSGTSSEPSELYSPHLQKQKSEMKNDHTKKKSKGAAAEESNTTRKESSHPLVKVHVPLDPKIQQSFAALSLTSPAVTSKNEASSTNDTPTPATTTNSNTSSNRTGGGGRGTAIDAEGLALKDQTIKDNRNPLPSSVSSSSSSSVHSIVKVTPSLETSHVHALYDAIAAHFSDTRHSTWPRVEAYLRSLRRGSFLSDIGCGNGKYLVTEAHPHAVSTTVPPSPPSTATTNTSPGVSTVAAPLPPLSRLPSRHLWSVGCDRSFGLTGIAGSRGCNVTVGDALVIPFRPGVADVAISIAVLHHISTRIRRFQLIQALLTTVRRGGGQILIYAWAQEQGTDSRRAFASQDVLVPWCLQKRYVPQELLDSLDTLGGTVDEVKKVVVFQRYCHVYIQGELEDLTSEACQQLGMTFVRRTKDSMDDGHATENHGKTATEEAVLPPQTLIVSGKKGDEGIQVTEETLPDAGINPVRIYKHTNSSNKEATKDTKDTGTAVMKTSTTVTEDADPISVRLQNHAKNQRNVTDKGLLPTVPEIRILDQWWEKDNWCLLLEKY